MNFEKALSHEIRGQKNTEQVSFYLIQFLLFTFYA